MWVRSMSYVVRKVPFFLCRSHIISHKITTCHRNRNIMDKYMNNTVGCLLQKCFLFTASATFVGLLFWSSTSLEVQLLCKLSEDSFKYQYTCRDVVYLKGRLCKRTYNKLLQFHIFSTPKIALPLPDPSVQNGSTAQKLVCKLHMPSRGNVKDIHSWTVSMVGED